MVASYLSVTGACKIGIDYCTTMKCRHVNSRPGTWPAPFYHEPTIEYSPLYDRVFKLHPKTAYFNGVTSSVEYDLGDGA